jgi:hypothetical protein
MSTKADERGWIAYHLYEEHRVEQITSHRAAYDDLPMWHELDTDQQDAWMRRAGRLQDWITTCRRLQRSQPTPRVPSTSEGEGA